jgi:hypothetical protein
METQWTEDRFAPNDDINEIRGFIARWRLPLRARCRRLVVAIRTLPLGVGEDGKQGAGNDRGR